MRLLLKTAFLSLSIVTGFTGISFCQSGNLFQLKEKQKRLEQQKDYLKDTAYLNTLNQVAFIYAISYPDSALSILTALADNCKLAGYKEGEADAYKITGNAYQTKGRYDTALIFFEKSFSLAEKIHYKKALPRILNSIGVVYLNQGNYSAALNKFYESLKDAEAIDNKVLASAVLNNIAIVHFYQGKLNEAESTYRETLTIAMEMSDTLDIVLAYNNIGEVNAEQKKYPEALQNFLTAHRLAVIKNNPEYEVITTNNLANIYFKLDSTGKAIDYFENALRLAKENDYGTAICKALIGLAKVKSNQGLFKEALANGLEGLQKAKAMGQVQLLRDANEIIADIYEASGDGNNAIKYFRVYKMYSDSLINIESARADATNKAGYEFSKKELEFERKTLQQRWLIFSALAALFTLIVIVWIISRNKKRLNHTYKDLQQKNIVIEAQKIKAEETLITLKDTQKQLIQSEKMASLGELTAGIAHEIQNPLNFVNNFSELNSELLIELKNEVIKGNIEEASAIANDIESNSEKINHHGKRADAIVKGMLQHSRSSSGIKEPTDINALCNEYLRLSYHGLRAKDKSFNATLKTDFDETIGKVNVIPQDMGRVILNLLTNAFYVVKEKSASTSATGQPYEPTVTVTTRRLGSPLTSRDGGKVEISVSDNGNGIPQKVLDKIFQPFFTTKPTGQGTGLGLSLSYDIVTKGHGGELKVETKEGEGSVFIINLPI